MYERKKKKKNEVSGWLEPVALQSCVQDVTLYVDFGRASGHENVQWSARLCRLLPKGRKNVNEELSGGYCSGVPPLPIPNREVKPACADGTAMQCGRVGGRHFSSEALIQK